jgi:hypothetical protein
MGKHLARVMPHAIATFYPEEGHLFVYGRWREILGTLLVEANARHPETKVDVPSAPAESTSDPHDATSTDPPQAAAIESGG